MKTPSRLFYEVQNKRLAGRLGDAMGGKFGKKVTIRTATILSPSQISVQGTRYKMDSSGLDVQPGQTLNVKNVSRLAEAEYVPADAYGGSGGTGGDGGGGTTPHKILSALHSDTVPGDVPVANDLLTYNGSNWYANGLIEIIRILGGLWIGRREGAHIGLFYVENADDDAAPGLVLQATNNDGVPFISASYRQDHTNTAHLVIGQDGQPQITLETPTATDGQPDELLGVVVPVDGLDRLILGADIDLADLARAAYVAHDTTLPDQPLDYPAGNLRLLQSPGDPNLFVLFVRDHLDNWQMIGGAGYMAPHTHEDEFTGGELAGGAFDDPTWVQDTDGTVLTDAGTGRYIATGNLQGDDIPVVAWDDLRISGASVRLGATAPTLAAFGPSGNLKVLHFDSAQHDEIHFEVQMPHNWAEGTRIYPHVHWTPVSATAGNVVWELEYAWASTGGTFGAPGNMASDATAAGGTAWVHKQTRLKEAGNDYIDGTGQTMSSMLVCRLHRNAGAGSDTLAADVAFLEFDIHYQIDSFGSRQELTK